MSEEVQKRDGPTSEMSWKKKLVYGLVTAFFVLAATELVLRVTLRELGRVSIPAESVEIHVRGGMAYDPDLGWTWRQVPQTALGINKDGFRHPDVSRPKPKGVWRGFTIGDSQTYGAGVDADQTYTAFAERALKKAMPHPDKVELLNAGISGYTSLQALRLIQKKLLKWDPDVIVIDCRTYDSLREGPLGAPSEGIATLQRLLFHSRIYYVLHFGIDRIRPVQPRRMHEHSEIRGAERNRFGNHDLIVTLGKQKGFGVVFVDYPFWNTSDDRIVCLAPPEELPAGQVVARGCLALQQSGYPPKELFLDNNHLKPLGNRIVGEALAKAILESDLAPR